MKLQKQFFLKLWMGRFGRQISGGQLAPSKKFGVK